MSKRVDKATLFASLPSAPDVDALALIQQLCKMREKTIFVLDDDPTGTQTVYDIPVLTEWSVQLLVIQMQQKQPVVYILTNSRSLDERSADALTHEVVKAIQQASESTGRAFGIISRSDSTLRGHFPNEVDIVKTVIKLTFDNTLLIPAFFEGGRYTINDIHYVQQGDELVPAGETEFANDSFFGYESSDLKDWVQEKTYAKINAKEVASIGLDIIRQGGSNAVKERLLSLKPDQICIINAATYHDLEIATLGIMQAEASDKRFLFRTAASFIRTYAGLDPRPLLNATDLQTETSSGGLTVVGSYVNKTTRQLAALFAATECVPVEVAVPALLEPATQQAEIDTAVIACDKALAEGRDVVIFTSRDLVKATNPMKSLSIGQLVSESLVQIMSRISTPPRFIVAKGGITSSDLATQALQVKQAIVMGQVLPGIPVWKLGEESRFPGIAYIIFPGNVGDDHALAQVVSSLGQKETL